MGYKKTCKECGRIFIGTCKRSVYCSYECRHAAAMRRQREYRRAVPQDGKQPKRYPRICPTCGVEFLATRVNGVYCSEECAAEAGRKRREERKAQARKNAGAAKEPTQAAVRTFGGETIYEICRTCHKSFPARYRMPYGHYCSAECLAAAEDKARRRTARAEASRQRAAQDAKKRPLTCEKCGRCHSCQYYDVADKTCGFCALNMESRGEPVGETCSRYKSATGRQRGTRNTRNNAVFTKI